MKNHRTSERILLLDLGGVLADLGDPVTAMGLECSLEEFWAIWLSSMQVRAFEVGELSIAEFCPGIAEELGQSDTLGFEKRLRAWQLRLFADAEEYIRSAAAHGRLALLSNTNELHWQQVVTSTQAFSVFEHTFLSFETGHYKPAPAAYQQVLEHFSCDPEDVLFLDDSPKNVHAARDLRIDAQQVHGIEQARAVTKSRYAQRSS